uniref:ACB domain-containing protein n=1 Tax=Globodera rostochiensis TaxID=31243 RepID=A0A914GZ71_GLORO
MASSPDERFNAAVDIVQKLPKEGPLQTSNDQKLKFYSLYKQATIGNVNTGRPGILSPIERAKWDAWKAVEGMSSEEAKEKYIETLLAKFDDAGTQVDISDWLSKIDPSIRTNLALLGKNI